MKLLKRTLCIFLSVLILFFGVSNSYFSPHKMDYSHAASGGLNSLTYEMMYYICFYVGSVAWSYFCAGEIEEIDKDDIAEFGHKVIQETVAPPLSEEINEQVAEDDPVLGMVAPSRQPYVYGRKALDDIANTLWVVLYDGMNDPDDDDDEENDNDNKNENENESGEQPEEQPETNSPEVQTQVKKDFFATADNLTSTMWMMSSFGANLIAQGISGLYEKYLDPDIDNDPITEFLKYHKQYDFYGYNDIWNEDAQMYDIKASASSYGNFGTTQGDIFADFSTMTATQLHIIADNGYTFRTNNGDAYKVSCTMMWYHPIYKNWRSANFSESSYNYCEGGSGDYVCTFTSNLPIFPSTEAWEEAFESKDYSTALNYSQTYQIGDWLSDDWSGDLIDPLTGLNVASDWFYFAKHEGLNKLFNFGVNIGADIANNYVRDYFANLDTDNGLDYDPVTNPLPSSIRYPSDMPEPTIDPNAKVALVPSTKPSTDPSPSPKPSTNPSIDPSTDPVADPDEVPEGLEDIVDEVPAIADDLGGVVDTFKKKFPFSIPWDIYYILNGLATTPKAPYFELPLKVERYGIDETIIVDMSRFQVLSDLSRSIFSMLFMIVLINLTIKVIGSIKEES